MVYGFLEISLFNPPHLPEEVNYSRIEGVLLVPNTETFVLATLNGVSYAQGRFFLHIHVGSTLQAIVIIFSIFYLLFSR